MKKTKFNSRTLAIIGLMSAVTFVVTKFISIPIPVAIGGKTRIHLGNSICVLSGLLFGGLPGGLAAGIGSALVDLTDPRWAPEFYITFINKFAMGFIAGAIAHMGKRSLGKDIVAATAGAFTYVALYLLKSYIGQVILGSAPEAIKGVLMTKAATSATNAVMAIVISVVLFKVIEPALKKARLFQDN